MRYSFHQQQPEGNKMETDDEMTIALKRAVELLKDNKVARIRKPINFKKDVSIEQKKEKLK